VDGAEVQELRAHETKSLRREVGWIEAGADGLRELETDQVAIALALETNLKTGAAEKRLRTHGLLLPGALDAADILRVPRRGRMAGEFGHDERPAITGDDENERSGDAGGSQPALGKRVPRDEQARSLRYRPRRGIGLFSGEDRLEGRLEPAMGVLQRIDAPGDDIVLLEHLLNRARLFACELPVDIGHEQFVAEFGHDGGPSG